MFGTQMCGQTLLFIAIAKGAIVGRPIWHHTVWWNDNVDEGMGKGKSLCSWGYNHGYGVGMGKNPWEQDGEGEMDLPEKCTTSYF